MLSDYNAEVTRRVLDGGTWDSHYDQTRTC